MLNKETILVSADNSGIIYARLIGFVPKIGSKELKLANFLTVMPKIIDFSKPLRKKKFLGLVIGLKKISRRSNGVWIKSNQNKILLLNESLKFLGTRVYGPICRDIRQNHNKNKFKKIISYSKLTL